MAKGGFTLGDRVAKFEPGSTADALAFIRGTGQTLTTGRKVVALATWNPFAVAGTIRGEVAFVDSKTGEVLAFIRFSRLGNMTKKTDERLADSLRQALHDLPLPLRPPKS